MKKITNINEVQEAGEGVRLPAGGYICKYTRVEDNANKNYLLMEFDITEGEFKGYFSDLNERAGFWAGKCYRSYTDKALPMFKRMCSAVTKSNSGYIFDGNTNSDETSLVGKLVGIVLGEEEYEGNDGNIKTRLYVSRECEVEKIRKGEFKVPELKKLVQASVDDKPDMNVPDEEVPFN